MKCPWMEFRVTTQVSERQTTEDISWKNCYEDECPFYEFLLRASCKRAEGFDYDD